MAISNEWQFVDNLNKIDISSTTEESYKANILDKDSTDRIASCIGWESVNLKAFSNTMTVDEISYPADNIYVVRPIDDDAYPYGILFYGTIKRGANTTLTGCCHIINLSTGTYISSADASNSYSNFRIAFLRPTAGGCLACKMYRDANNFSTIAFDKFINVKNGLTKWCLVKIGKMLFNLDTGETLLCVQSDGSHYRIINPSPNFYPYVALKKFTAINTTSIFTALSLYTSYIDYSYAERTIELEGDQYRAVLGYSSSAPLYIPLA